MRQLMYGCEYIRNGQLYRKSPDQDLQSLLWYMQSPYVGEEPTCKLVVVKDTKTYTMISLFIDKQIQPHEELTIDMGDTIGNFLAPSHHGTAKQYSREILGDHLSPQSAPWHIPGTSCAPNSNTA